MLIVVHASTQFDEKKSAAAGIDELVQEFKTTGRPVVYLVSEPSPLGSDHWYTADRSPDFEVFSEGGEHNLPVSADEVTIVGGFFGSTDTMNGCHALAIKDAIRMHFEFSSKPFTVHLPMSAIYFYSEWEEFRRELLETGSMDLSKIEIEKYPFASLFFLREGNNGAGDDGYEQNFAHQYSGKANQTYRPGEDVNRQKYQFNFSINNRLIESLPGPGERVVNINLIPR
ncbi:MAG: hypothetical protein OM95_14875 [Bdellovibrio sp. ArHS]|uniref:hypothetical protein n=1 Tax=Bdellovibrio sp. ArHS TaxID=1569284 RepID=UPI00058370C4|nr:hypothetical protein [Bdellovibrio sp. ArHS]KHD87378.1 MAG: hypothetical protein OM95_14875 [Bdellovibrio sp. ArHS]